MRSQVVFVDDDTMILDAYRRLLRQQEQEWEMHFFSDSCAAWDFLKRNNVDAVVSDVAMPRLTGFELLANLRSDPRTAELPVAMLTGSDDTGLKREALDSGATDLLSKPIRSSELISRVRSMIRVKKLQDQLKRKNSELDAMVRQRTRQLEFSRMQIIWRLGKAAEFRDEETGEHVARVACSSRLLAQALGTDSQFVDELFLAAPLHDIGKIGMPDAILLKPGKLTPEERRIMETHCEIGERILREPHLSEVGLGLVTAFQDLPRLPFDTTMQHAREVAISHHERWDGTGYPYRLSREQIPLSARIVSVADVFDALTSHRPYKPAFTVEEAVRVIASGRGTHFDPAIVDAFLEIRSEIIGIRGDVSVAVRQATMSSVTGLLSAASTAL